MARRIMVFGAATGVFVAALLVILAILDVISAEQLRDSLGKTLLVVAVATGALVAMLAIGGLGRSQASGPGQPDPQEPARNE